MTSILIFKYIKNKNIFHNIFLTYYSEILIRKNIKYTLLRIPSEQH